MCLVKTPKQKDPVLPPERAQMRDPDAGAVRSTTGRRATDRMRSAAQTILTSGEGVTSAAATEKKTLLGA